MSYAAYIYWFRGFFSCSNSHTGRPVLVQASPGLSTPLFLTLWISALAVLFFIYESSVLVPLVMLLIWCCGSALVGFYYSPSSVNDGVFYQCCKLDLVPEVHFRSMQAWISFEDQKLYTVGSMMDVKTKGHSEFQYMVHTLLISIVKRRSGTPCGLEVHHKTSWEGFHCATRSAFILHQLSHLKQGALYFCGRGGKCRPHNTYDPMWSGGTQSGKRLTPWQWEQGWAVHPGILLVNPRIPRNSFPPPPPLSLVEGGIPPPTLFTTFILLLSLFIIQLQLHIHLLLQIIY